MSVVSNMGLPVGTSPNSNIANRLSTTQVPASGQSLFVAQISEYATDGSIVITQPIVSGMSTTPSKAPLGYATFS